MEDEQFVNWRSNVDGKGIVRRIPLKDILPLDTPLTLNVEASAFCCLRCNYCPQSLSDEWKVSHNIGKGYLGLDVFKRFVEQCEVFPGTIKTLRFAGFGEPLLNPNISEMVAIAKQSKKIDNVTIFTNGIPLNRDLSTKLADAGLDTLLIDIQGLSSSDYIRVANTKVDFNNLVANIRGLYKLPGWKGRIFIKTFKYIVAGREKEFYEYFKGISDDISIDDIYEQCKDVDFEGMITEDKASEKFGFTKTRYCAYPWFHISLAANGDMHVCPAPISYSDKNLQIGNIARGDNIVEAWQGYSLNAIRKRLLEDGKKPTSCEECDYLNNIPPEDAIDSMAEELKAYCVNERKD